MDKLEKIPEVDEVFVVTNSKFVGHFKSWKETNKSRKKMTIVDDGTLRNEDRLGAIGDIHFVLQNENIKDDVLVVAGDNLFEFSLKKFVDFYKKKKGSIIAAYDLKDRKKLAHKYGVVELDGEGRIVHFEEKPAKPKTSLASTACYIFSKDDLKKVPDYIQRSDRYDNPGDFIKWLNEKSPVYGFTFIEKWFDIGSFEALEEAYEAYGKKQ